MKRIALVGAALGAFLTAPSMAQQYKQPVVQRDTVPVQISQEKIRILQQKLKDKGFPAGPVDGFWGPKTSGALQQFQAQNKLNPTGELDRTTELKLGMIEPGTGMATPVPPTGPIPYEAPAPMPVVVVPGPATVINPAAPPPPAAALITPANPGQSSTASNVPHPTPPKPTAGANSFTESEARGRLGDSGYQDVHDLTLDDKGVWRGTATKNGQSVHVWLDYQGDVGQQPASTQ